MSNGNVRPQDRDWKAAMKRRDEAEKIKHPMAMGVICGVIIVLYIALFYTFHNEILHAIQWAMGDL